MTVFFIIIGVVSVLALWNIFVIQYLRAQQKVTEIGLPSSYSPEVVAVHKE